mmetsp:Transcript_37236/g.115715  ORF Transcript_37236/g.115715 Transcript_37236/m.115715 type:complete len:320 (+) Transcript_37236:1-960(+)
MRTLALMSAGPSPWSISTVSSSRAQPAWSCGKAAGKRHLPSCRLPCKLRNSTTSETCQPVSVVSCSQKRVMESAPAKSMPETAPTYPFSQSGAQPCWPGAQRNCAKLPSSCNASNVPFGNVVAAPGLSATILAGVTLCSNGIASPVLQSTTTDGSEPSPVTRTDGQQLLPSHVAVTSAMRPGVLQGSVRARPSCTEMRKTWNSLAAKRLSPTQASARGFADALGQAMLVSSKICKSGGSWPATRKASSGYCSSTVATKTQNQRTMASNNDALTKRRAPIRTAVAASSSCFAGITAPVAVAAHGASSSEEHLEEEQPLSR